MKFISYYIFFSFSLLISCARETECCDNNSSIIVTTETEKIPVISTAEEIEPIRNLPEGFLLDSIFAKETAEVFYTQTVYFPISISDSRFNSKMKKFVEKEISLERPDNKSKYPAQTFFDMWLTKIEIIGKKIVCDFHLQSFTGGAAHYTHDDISFEYSSK